MKIIMRTFFTFILVTFSFSMFAENSDTLVTLDEVVFQSKLEEETVKDFLVSGQTDYFKLFVISSGINNEEEYKKIKQQFLHFYLKNPGEKMEGYNENKKIKTIYKEVHTLFFKKYALETCFSDIFKNGNFNCVTASALYGIILHDLNIPFVVREMPSHVYLVAYPKTLDIKIETIDPVTGYNVFEQSKKRIFVEYLKDNKIISQEEFEQGSTEELFNRYFFSDKEIGLKELAGIHYLNRAFYKISDQKFKDGYHLLEKAYLFYPSEMVRYAMFATLAEIIKNHDYKDVSDLKYLVRICRFSNMISLDEIRGEFSVITYNYLINESNLTYYDTIYLYLMSNIENADFKKEISFIYYYEKGRFLYNRQDAQRAHECFSKALFLKPDHAEIQTLFVQSLSGLVADMPVSNALQMIEGYYKSDSILFRNIVFKRLLLQAYLAGAYESFTMQQAMQGELCLTKFESLYSSNSEININTDLIGEAYSSAGIYYFKRGNYTKSKKFIERGLKYAPYNFNLIRSRNSF